MRPPAVGALLATAWLISACGSTAVDTITAPSSMLPPPPAAAPSPAPAPAPAPAPQPFRSLTGDWRAVGSVTLTDQATGSTSSYVCTGALRVSTQTGGEFSGAGQLTGNGSSSDRYCSFSGSFAGVVTDDGSVTSFRLQPPLQAHACTPVSGDGTFTGTASAAGPIRLEAKGQWRCGMATAQPFDAQRTVSLTLERR